MPCTLNEKKLILASDVKHLIKGKREQEKIMFIVRETTFHEKFLSGYGARQV